jgi:hypothetical protein
VKLYLHYLISPKLSSHFLPKYLLTKLNSAGDCIYQLKIPEVLESREETLVALSAALSQVEFPALSSAMYPALALE